MKETEIMTIDEQSLKNKVYIVRGVQIMLDFELAQIYGYTTGKMNERVKDNIERFEGEEFRFQLTKDEYNNFKSERRVSSWGGRRTLPFAFTEQGVYNIITKKEIYWQKILACCSGDCCSYCNCECCKECYKAKSEQIQFNAG